jgi:hypothetical protein
VDRSYTTYRTVLLILSTDSIGIVTTSASSGVVSHLDACGLRRIFRLGMNDPPTAVGGIRTRVEAVE